MMKFSFLAALLAVSTAKQANAQVVAYAPAPSIAWACNVSAQVSGFDAAFIIRSTDLWGRGQVSCISEKGDRFFSPIVVNMTGFGVGAQIAAPTGAKSCFKISNGNIGLTDPRAMFGQFRGAVDVGYQVGAQQGSIGAGVQMTLRNRGGASGQVQLKSTCGTSVGLGVGVNLTGVNIMTPDQADIYRRQRGLPPIRRAPPVAPAQELAPPPAPAPRQAPAVRQAPEAPAVINVPPPPPPPAAKKKKPAEGQGPEVAPPPPPPPPPPATTYDQETPAPASR